MIQFEEIDTRPYLYTTDELLSITQLQKTIEFDDGAIYFIQRK